MRLTVVFVLFLSIVNAHPQGFLSQVASALGIGVDESTPATPGKTLVPPATVAASTPSAKSTKATQASSNTQDPLGKPNPTTSSVSTPTATTKHKSTTSTDSSSDDDSDTITTAPTTIPSTLVTSTSAPPLLTSVIPTPPPPAISDQPSQPTTSSSSIPAGGIAVAVIMSIAVLIAILWMIFRYHPTVRAKYLAWEEKRMEERSYRDAIDGPFASKGHRSHGVRDEALGSSRPTSRKSMLSFFAPRTVKLGNGKEIRRKPVNWGAGAPEVPPIPMPEMSKSSSMVELPGHAGIEKVALKDMAAPMGRNASTKTYRSTTGSSNGSSAGGDNKSVAGYAQSNTSSLTAGQRELPAIPLSPISMRSRDVRSNVSSPSLAPRDRDMRSNVSSPSLMSRDWSISRSPSVAVGPQVELPGSSPFVPQKKPLPKSSLSSIPSSSSPTMHNELPGSSPVVATPNELPGSSPVVPALTNNHSPAIRTAPPTTSPSTTTTPPPILPTSTPTPLPAIPIPAIPTDSQKKDMHTILSRKSIFELA